MAGADPMRLPAPVTKGLEARDFRHGLAVLALCLSLAACAGSDSRRSTTSSTAGNPDLAYTLAATGGQPRIVSPKRRLQCVPYARKLSNIQIRGDAWTWWQAARGRYHRGDKPTVGSVLVLGRKGQSRGHLAVVTRIVSDREIVANHANWLNRGKIHLDTPIRDVSPGNDWSAVRVWYTPGSVLGRSTYPAHGFIYPRVKTAAR